MRSILLDFCNRDIRAAAGLFDNLHKDDHAALLGSWINLAILLTPDRCILPLGFPAECDILQVALRRKWSFLDEGLIRISSREPSVSTFLRKRRQEYRFRSVEYPVLYAPETEVFLNNLVPFLLAREGNSGDSIASQWENRQDDFPGWNKILGSVSAKQVDQIRRRPRILKSRGDAVLWRDLSDLVPGMAFASSKIRNLLNHDMLEAYASEYELDVLTNLPFGWRDILGNRGRSDLNLEHLKILLGQQLFQLLCSLSAEQILNLKADYEILQALETICLVPRARDYDTQQLRLMSAKSSQTVKNEMDKLFPQKIAIDLVMETKLSSTKLQVLKATLVGIARSLKNDDFISGFGASRMPNNIASAMTPVIALFAALDMEAKIIAKGLNLVAKAHGWEGKVNGADVVLYSPMEMGRVAACVATMNLLATLRPSLILILGIAGGFAKNNVRVGQVVIPENVIDMSLRKIYEDEGTEFRPKPFNLDSRIVKHVRSPIFPKDDWSFEAARELDWPEDRRPSLIVGGDITSLDEVVANTDHIAALLRAYPKLWAVEMEAGGVCAAATHYGVPVSIIRGISDQADPSKKDDEWRKRVMETVVSLVKKLDFPQLLKVTA